jgi:DNA ligase D-like protein (predicted ligase)
MQAVATDGPFSSEEYLFEVKWDGLRCLLFVDREGRVRLQDRALHDLTGLLPELSTADRQVRRGSVLDGELVATDAEGRPDPARLRRRLAGGLTADDVPVAFLAFDALYLGGRPVLRQPLHRRKARMRNAVTPGGHLFVPDHIPKEGVELFDACVDRGLEGVMAKHIDSTYVPGQRSPFWLKVKAVKRDDFVVLGATPGEPFGALLVGYHEDSRLLPCGSVAGGFDDDDLRVFERELARLAQDESPLQPPPVLTAPVRWCRPELVVSVRYSDWASDGTLRFPIFDTVRRDVHPAECIRQRPRVVVSERSHRSGPAYDLTHFPF